MSRSRLPLYMPLWLRQGSAMMSPADIREFSEAYGSWKTICTRPRNFSRSLPRRLKGSMPSKRTVPESGRSSIINVLASVDFPQPDSPTRPRVSPRPRSRVMPSSAVSLLLPALGTLNDLRRSRTSSSFSDMCCHSCLHAGRNLFGEVARGPAAGRHGLKDGALGGADVAGERAARLIYAALRDRVQVRWRAADRRELVAAARVDRDGVQQA